MFRFYVGAWGGSPKRYLMIAMIFAGKERRKSISQFWVQYHHCRKNREADRSSKLCTLQTNGHVPMCGCVSHLAKHKTNSLNTVLDFRIYQVIAQYLQDVHHVGMYKTKRPNSEASTRHTLKYPAWFPSLALSQRWNFCWHHLTPRKINGWDLKIIQLKRTNHLPNLHYCVPCQFSGV